jgi:nucleoside-diphosphate-sugar epimerase
MKCEILTLGTVHIQQHFLRFIPVCLLNFSPVMMGRYDECLAAFTSFRPTHIIHLAAQVGGLFKNMARKFDMANDNFIINSNVLNAASALRVQRVVSMTSTCVFPDKTECVKSNFLNPKPLTIY